MKNSDINKQSPNQTRYTATVNHDNEVHENMLDTSTHSMDVSPSTTPNNVQFQSPPRINETKKRAKQSPAQRRRRRKHNLRKFKQRKFAEAAITTPLTKKPILPNQQEKNNIVLPTNTISKQTNENVSNDIMNQEQTHTTHNNRDKKDKTENNNQTNTIRVVEYITDSKDVSSNNTNIRGLTVIAEPSTTIVPTYTINYAEIKSNYTSDIINTGNNESTSMNLHYLNMNDAILHISEILFQFTESETNQNWYYCHYIDLDLHSNVVLLNERDVPNELLHRFIIEHDIHQDCSDNCQQCQKNCHTNGKRIGYYAPCYLHRRKQNKKYHHPKDHKDLIKHIQKTCQKINKQAQQLTHNPIIHTTRVDQNKELYCSTVLPTNHNHWPVQQVQTEPMEDSDTIFGVTTTNITIPSSIPCETCNHTHKPTISYNIYKDAFICDRCGYGQNPYDIIYRLSDEHNSNENKCEEIDICCNCAINIANAKDEDNDIFADLDSTQHNNNKARTNARTNVPMINTRFIHKKRKPPGKTIFKPCINYSFQQQAPTPPQAAPQQIRDKKDSQSLDHKTERSQQHNQQIISTIVPRTNKTITQKQSINTNKYRITQSKGQKTNNVEEKDNVNNKHFNTISTTVSVPQHTSGLVMESDDESEAPPLMINPQPPKQAKITSPRAPEHAITPSAHSPLPKQDHPDEPPGKRQRRPKATTIHTNQQMQDCTNCHTSYNTKDLWRCKNKFKCNKLLCLQCLIKKGYNKYYMLNCNRHWYCNECLEKDFQERQEKEKQRLQQQQHATHKKKYGPVKYQNKLHCNVSCYKKDGLYATQRGLQIHSIQYGWATHQHMPVWNFWKVKPCLYCLNKFTTHQHNNQYHSHSISSYTAADVQWINSNNNTNLCNICTAETNNDPNKSIEKLETENQWMNTNFLDTITIDKLIDGKRNYIAELLRTDTMAEIYNKEIRELPTLLEIDSINIEQVEKIPANMLGRIKIILNKILYNIITVQPDAWDEQMLLLKQLMMIWKIITQKRVRSNSTYSGYTKRSNMDFTIKLIESDQWAHAWNNMLINKITRNIKNIETLTKFNNMLHNIRERQGEFDYKTEEQDQEMQDKNNELIRDESKADELPNTPQVSEEEKKDESNDTIHTHNIYMHQAHVHNHQQHKQRKFNLKRAQYLASQGKYKKAIQALESQGLCPNTIKYRNNFKSKLESENGKITLPQLHANTKTQFQFDLKHIKSIAKSMDHTTGAGADAMKIQYLKQVVNNTDDIPELLSNIATFFNRMANGELPRIIANHIRHSRQLVEKN